MYAFGRKLSADTGDPGYTHCGVETYSLPNCTGTTTPRVDTWWVNVNWPAAFISDEFASGLDVSARVFCYREGGGQGSADMLYLTNTSLGTRY
jgi:hypothetical protein